MFFTKTKTNPHTKFDTTPAPSPDVYKIRDSLPLQKALVESAKVCELYHAEFGQPYTYLELNRAVVNSLPVRAGFDRYCAHVNIEQYPQRIPDRVLERYAEVKDR